MTNKQQLERLKEPYRSQALENHKNCSIGHHRNWLKRKSITFVKTLESSFVFQNTPQGHKYWWEIRINPQNYTTDGED